MSCRICSPQSRGPLKLRRGPHKSPKKQQRCNLRLSSDVGGVTFFHNGRKLTERGGKEQVIKEFGALQVVLLMVLFNMFKLLC